MIQKFNFKDIYLLSILKKFARKKCESKILNHTILYNEQTDQKLK